MKIGLREWIFVALLAAIPVGAYFLVFTPHNKAIADANVQIQQKHAKLQRLARATRDIEDLGKEVDKLREAIDFFESKLPPADQIDRLLKEVWQIADSNGLVTKSFRTMSAESKASYNELPILMQLEGEFEGFYAFLLALEQLPRITRIGKMELNKDNNAEGRMRAVITLSIFFEGDNRPVAYRK